MDQFLVGAWTAGPVYQNVTPRNPDRWFLETFGGVRSETGERITEMKMIAHEDIWQAVQVYAGTIGQLPLHLRRASSRGSRDVVDNSAYQLASIRPNKMQSVNVWRELMIHHALIWGNGVAEIARGTDGRPMTARNGGGLTVLDPSRTEMEMTPDGEYVITTTVEVTPGSYRTYAVDPDDAVHLMGLSNDGMWGYRLSYVLRNAIAGATATSKHKRTLFANRARPDGVLTTQAFFPDDTQYERFRKRWEEVHQGLDNVGRTAILEHGMTYQPFTMTSEDAQMIESLKLDTIKIANIFGMPAHLLNYLDRATFTNIEEQNRDWVNRGLGRWLNKMREELRYKLLTDREQVSLDFWWDLDALLKGLFKERWLAYAQAIASTALSPNEVRELEGWDPFEGGDEHKNPNTSADRPSREEGDQDRDDMQQARRLAAKTYARQVSQLLRTEANRLRRAAESERNFVNWLDEFYLAEWNCVLSEAGFMSSDTAAGYCLSRRSHWLTVTGEVTSTEQLTDRIANEAATIGERTRAIMTKELQDEIPQFTRV